MFGVLVAVVRWVLFVDWRMLFVVICGLSFKVRCVLIVACCLMCNVCCLLFVVCCCVIVWHVARIVCWLVLVVFVVCRC